MFAIYMCVLEIDIRGWVPARFSFHRDSQRVSLYGLAISEEVTQSTPLFDDAVGE